MDGVSPVVRSLWRLIHILQEEELERNKKRKTAEGTHTINDQYVFDMVKCSTQDSTINIEKTTSDAEDKRLVTVDNNALLQRNTFQSKSSVESSKHNPKRRVPSLKQSRAPTPPRSQYPDSSVCKAISSSDVSPADQQGWLIDQLRGRKVWCAITKKILCVFDSDTSQTSKHVIHLSGCQVRHLELTSSDENGKVLNGVTRHFSTKPISVVNKFQFILENPISRQKYFFGATSRSELNQWVSSLEIACGPNTPQLLLSVDKANASSGENTNMKVEERKMSSGGETRQNKVFLSSSDAHILSESKTFSSSRNSSASSSSSVSIKDTKSTSNLQKKFQKQKSGEKNKPAPLKGNHKLQENPEMVAPMSRRHDDNSHSSRPLFKIRSSLNVLFNRKKRSASVDESKIQKNLKKVHVTEIGSQNVLTDINTSSYSHLNQIFPLTNVNYTHDVISHSNPSYPRRSVESRGRSRHRGVSHSLRRAASDLRDKFFRLRSPSQGPTSKSDGVRLKDLAEINISGWLRYRKDDVKFTKMHCVLSRGCFYAFRSDRKEEVSELALALSQSSVTYISGVEDRTENLLTFMVSQPNCRDIFLCADDPQSLMTWMMAMQLESSKILAVENASSEIGYVKPSLKDTLARNTDSIQSTFPQTEFNSPQTNPPPCPHIAVASLDLLENPTGPNRGEDLEIVCDCYERQKNYSTERIGGFIETDKCTDQQLTKHSSMQPPHLTTNEVEDNENAAENKTSLQLPHETHQIQGNVVKNLAQCYQTIVNTEELALSASRVIPRQSTSLPSHEPLQSTPMSSRELLQSPPMPSHEPLQSTPMSSHELLQSTSSSCHQPLESTSSSSHEPPVTKQLCLTNFSNLERSSSLRKNKFQENNTENAQNVSLSDLPLDLDVNLLEKGNSFSSGNLTEDIESLNLSAINQKEHGSLPKTNEPIGVMLSTSCDQSMTECPQKPFRFDSYFHDDVLKETWSTKEEFLMEIIRQKLRVREKKEAAKIQLGHGQEVLCIVNDQWNSMDAHETNLSVPAEQTMSTQPLCHVPMSHEVEEFGRGLTLDNPSEDHANQSPNQSVGKEGFLEMLGFDDQWQRYWCVLCNDCLCCYQTPEDKTPVEVIHLAGYDLTLTTDQTQGKHYILSLKHLKKTSIILSAICAENYKEWFESIKILLDNLTKSTTKQETSVQAGKSQLSEENKQVSPSETVKQKLLAEVLRQKSELEKLHAARAGSKVDLRTFGKNRSVSPTLEISVTSEEEKTSLVTRLTQRRMSAQIMLNAVQKQMETASFSSKDKKMFLIGKKKPDLVQGHSEFDTQRPDLEMQARLLSSKLRELDSRLLSHGASSPHIQSKLRSRSQRHSYDQALLKRIQLEAESRRDNNEENHRDFLNKSKDKEKLRDITRNISLKSSVQKFAHKTLAKANLYLSKKSMNRADGKGSLKTAISNNLSDVTPDVIDGTINETINGLDFPEPVNSFQKENFFLNRTLPMNHKIDPNLKLIGMNLSKCMLSSSLTKLDSFSGKIRTSTSSPLLCRLATKSDMEACQTLNSTDAIVRETENGFKENKTLSVLEGSSSQGSKGSIAQRRQVSASTLAEIEAFEELSMKFLTNDSGSK